MALWARGLLGTVGEGVTVLLERLDVAQLEEETSALASSTGPVSHAAVGPAASSVSTKGDSSALSNVVVLRVVGRERDSTIQILSEFVDQIDMIAAEWKIEWETFIDLRPLYLPLLLCVVK